MASPMAASQEEALGAVLLEEGALLVVGSLLKKYRYRGIYIFEIYLNLI